MLKDVRSAAELAAICAAEPWLLNPAIARGLRAMETDATYSDAMIDQIRYARLQLDSIRDGRNLRATYGAMLRAASHRAIRDLAVAEPLMLDPLFDRLMRRTVRGMRQQGEADNAQAIEYRREILAGLRDQGLDAGYFEWLVSAVTTTADPERVAAIVQQNRDLIEPLRRYALERAGTAARLGESSRSQQWLAALALFSADTVQTSTSAEHHDLSDRSARLLSLLLVEVDVAVLRQALGEDPHLLDKLTVRMADPVLEAEMARAADARDVVRLRQLWRRRALLKRAADSGPHLALAEWEGGELCPSHDATL